eukprot:TRINITY_DN18322_c0_g1_i1.p1 TRINITY_DN18322_c0_g1~~TRINITY_DN18322_c0_g1_i1.p1  ORF type:complete len:228 (+),score=32.52 TRINITY_DN18322_c0_g1_i1:151-834(+)
MNSFDGDGGPSLTEVVPAELLENVVLRLPLATVAAVGRTCRALHAISSSDGFWHHKYLIDFPCGRAVPDAGASWRSTYVRVHQSVPRGDSVVLTPYGVPFAGHQRIRAVATDTARGRVYVLSGNRLVLLGEETATVLAELPIAPIYLRNDAVSLDVDTDAGRWFVVGLSQRKMWLERATQRRTCRWRPMWHGPRWSLQAVSAWKKRLDASTLAVDVSASTRGAGSAS